MKLTFRSSNFAAHLGTAAEVLLSVVLLFATPVPAAESTSTATVAINALGIDLLRQAGKPDSNALLSPYSIQCALAMAHAGAEGETSAEMAKVLHYPRDQARLHDAFAALQRALDHLVQRSAQFAERQKQRGAIIEPVTLMVASRLFGQTGAQYREPFLALVSDKYRAPLAQLDFARDSAGATKLINVWVEDQTRQRIRNLIPGGALNGLTRLVLVNAIYFKAPWAEHFEASATKPLPFHSAGGQAVDVPTMTGKLHVGYARRGDFTVVAIPYRGGELQFLVLLPDNVNGLAALERKLTPGLLAEGAKLPTKEVLLYLPKFKFEAPVMSLGAELQTLGMTSAFDVPPGSANFDRMVPRRPNDYVYLSKVFHKTFLNVDEQGAEAAAATSVGMTTASVARQQPIEVRVDRPFVFAIQHRPSGACLFLGHVTDPDCRFTVSMW